jgi:hypothetical protein
MAKKTENKSKVSFVNLSTYTSPEIVESNNKEWVGFGDNNSYFNYLIDRYNGSATNNAVINSVSQMIYGKGLDATNSAKKPEQYARMISLFKKEDVRRLAYDLKLSGQCAIQVVYSSDRKSIVKVEHLPIETLCPEKIADGAREVQAYYYHPNWAEKKTSDEPKRIPAFGVSKSPAPLEILYIKPYKAGMYYFSTPDYQGGLQYAELEEEISNYHINNIMNGLAPSMLINFNNGTPSEQAQREIEASVARKFSGSSNAGSFILAFNDNKESSADITPVQLSDAASQYEFLSGESQKKIMVSHRIVSPRLLGVNDSSGFGNNADELETASILMQNTVIVPFQEMLIDAFDKILAFNGISLKLYFKTLQPLQFIDLENVHSEETREEETGVKMAKQNEGFEDGQMLDSLEGEEIDEEWELVDSRECDEENESVEDWAKSKIKEKLSIIKKLAGIVKSKPNGFSYLDKSFYKVRYAYAEKYSSENSRDFCKAMMKRSSNGVVYRLEDIDQASASGVNESFGHKKEPYDLFKWKGGKQCGHVWSEQLYRLKKKTEKDAKQISKYDETDSVPSTYKPKPRGNKESKIAPKDMPNGGAHPSSK